MKIRTGIIELISNESVYLYLFRVLGGVIGLCLSLNFVSFDELEFPLMIFGLVAAFVFWGFGINILGYQASNLVLIFGSVRLNKERIYRCLILGHLPLVLAVLSARGIELVENRGIFLSCLWVASIVISVTLIIWLRKN